LSNAKDKTGRTALVEYSNEGQYIATHWMPTKDASCNVTGAEFADGYCYDARVLPRKNVLLTTSFTGWNNYMRTFGDLAKDANAMKSSARPWSSGTFTRDNPGRSFSVPGAPLEIRWAWGATHNYAFTASALGSRLLALLRGHQRGMEGEGCRHHRRRAAASCLWTSASARTTTRCSWIASATASAVFMNVSNPHQPRMICEKQIGRQLNMVSQSWDGKRLYFSSSLLARWDKSGDDNEQFSAPMPGMARS
jgi:selenium-binding protein 1